MSLSSSLFAPLEMEKENFNRTLTTHIPSCHHHCMSWHHLVLFTQSPRMTDAVWLWLTLVTAKHNILLAIRHSTQQSWFALSKLLSKAEMCSACSDKRVTQSCPYFPLPTKKCIACSDTWVTVLVRRPRACKRMFYRCVILRVFAVYCQFSDDNLFHDVSVIVQRRSWCIDYMYSLSYFSAIDIFYSDGFHCEVDWSVGLCPRQPCWHIRWSICAPTAGIDWTSDSTICKAVS